MNQGHDNNLIFDVMKRYVIMSLHKSLKYKLATMEITFEVLICCSILVKFTSLTTI